MNSSEKSAGEGNRWVFECTECGKQWINPDGPVTGHYCDWHGHGVPPEDMEAADVRVVEKPTEGE